MIQTFVISSDDALHATLAEHITCQKWNSSSKTPLHGQATILIMDTGSLLLLSASDVQHLQPLASIILCRTDTPEQDWDTLFTLHHSFYSPFRLGDMLDAHTQLCAQLTASDARHIRLSPEIELSPTGRRITHTSSGGFSELTEKEALLLETLATAGENGLPRETLLEKIWGYNEDINTHTLETHLYRLRQKCKELGGYSGISLRDGIYYIDFSK